MDSSDSSLPSRFADLAQRELSSGEWLELAAEMEAEQERVRAGIEERYATMEHPAGQTLAALEAAMRQELEAALAPYAAVSAIIAEHVQADRALVRNVSQELTDPDRPIAPDDQPRAAAGAAGAGASHRPFFASWWFWLLVVLAVAAALVSY